MWGVRVLVHPADVSAPSRVRRSRTLATAACLALLAQAMPMAVRPVAATVVEPGFQVATIASGLDTPTAVAIVPDGRIFVTERAGRVLEFDNASDPTPTTVVDLSTQVHSVGDRGLLGLAADPQFSVRPYIYVLYMVDAPPGGNPPFYNDACPSPRAVRRMAARRLPAYHESLSVRTTGSSARSSSSSAAASGATSSRVTRLTIWHSGPMAPCMPAPETAGLPASPIGASTAVPPTRSSRRTPVAIHPLRPASH